MTPLDTQPNWNTELAAAEYRASGWITADTPAECLRLAEVRLMQASECRVGYLQDIHISEAAALLRRAACGELADRIEDDPWGSELDVALAEVKRICGEE